MPVTRFAPSPTGRLHVGHAFSARFARNAANGSRFLLRIEDIDFERSHEEFVEGIIEDLRWLGLNWDGDVLFQSQRMSRYQQAMERLASQGLVYPCFCSRKEVLAEIERVGGAPHGSYGPVYPGTCRSLENAERCDRISRGDPYCLRFDVNEASRQFGPVDWYEVRVGRISGDLGEFGDIVLGQRDSGLSYFLCCTVDDAEQGVELVTRGEDLRSSSVVQRLIQVALGLPEPQYHHHRLVVDESGSRLAKRSAGLAIGELREEGWSPQQIFEFAESRLG